MFRRLLHWRKFLLTGGSSVGLVIVSLQATAACLPPGNAMHMLMSYFSPLIALTFLIGLALGLAGMVLLFVRTL